MSRVPPVGSTMRRNNEWVADRGKRVVMNTGVVAGGVQLLPTPVIRANLPMPRELLITVMPPTRGSGVVPYVSSFDGTNVVPTAANFSAPTLAGGALYAALQVQVRWGAGGVRSETAFDYPALGGTFSLTADSFDVGVGLKQASGAVVYNSPDLVPVVAMHYVEGAPCDPTPMAWLENTTALAGAGDLWWAIKPFAKDVDIIVTTTGAAVERYGVEWYNTNGVQIRNADFLVQAPGSDVRTLQVPRQASLIHIVNRTAVAKTVSLEWGIGLS